MGVEEACVHHPLYLVTRILPGVPPCLPDFEKFLDSLRSRTGPQSCLCRPPCASRPAWGGYAFPTPATKIFQWFPPGFQILDFSWLVAGMFMAPVASVPPPCARNRAWGGVRPLQTLGPKLRQGFPPWGQMFCIFTWACCLQHPARLHPTSWRMHPWVSIVRGRWGRGATSGTTDGSSCPGRVIPVRLPEAA